VAGGGIAVFAALVLALALPLAPAGAATRTPSVAGAFGALVRATGHLPRGAAGRKVRRQLLNSAKRARKLASRRPCRALSRLAAYRRSLRRVHKRARGRRIGAATLASDATAAAAALLSSGAARRCGGATVAPTDRPRARIMASDAKHLTLRVSFPAARFVGRSGAGRAFTRVVMDGVGDPGGVGGPELPGMNEQFAIPQGASASVRIGSTSSYTIGGVDVAPLQQQPVDTLDPRFADRPFRFDPGAYRSRAPFPHLPAQMGLQHAMRDLNVGELNLAGAQYQPGLRRLRVFTRMDVTVTFGGASRGYFADDRLMSPWNLPAQKLYRDSIANFDAVAANLVHLRRYLFCGEDLLIVTPAALAPAAQTLAGARQADGFRTSVVQTGGGPGQIGTTNTQIQSYIRGELTSVLCLVRPSYVVLMGSASQLPTFEAPDPRNPMTATVASDLPYSTTDDSHITADAALGRIPAPDLATANTVVGKIVNYEDNPPVSADFFKHGTIASYFQGPGPQDQRTFLRTSETIRDALQSLGGFLTRNVVDRVYDDDSSSVDPQTYDDGSAIPGDLRKPSFNWNGNCCTSDITNDWNAGRFFILHRDHGYPGGWGNPSYDQSQIASLTNGALLPVVFSVNCSSAQFDGASPSFVEQIVDKSGGGAVGAIGDTRVSPSGHNSTLTLGFFDAIFPSVLPSYGSSTPIRRMGDVLNAGKAYLDTQYAANDTNRQFEHYAYHYFGDPSMQLYGGFTAAPPHIDLSKVLATYQSIPVVNPGDPPFRVGVNVGDPGLEGAAVTLMRQGVPVGRGIVSGGQAFVSPDDGGGDTSNLSVSVDQDDYVTGSKPVSGTPSPTPGPPAPAKSTLTQSCPSSDYSYSPMTVSGTLSPAQGGVTISVTYTKPDGSTVVHSATTDAGGNWSDSITPSGVTGPWTIKSHYAGDASHAAADAGPCTVTVY
jgi:hypothetical protein